MQKIRFSYNQITQMCEELAEKIQALPKEEQPEVIIGIVRGGAVPAVILSHMLKLPVKMLHYSSVRGCGDDLNHDNQIPADILAAPRQLFVDDICDSGYTLKEIFNALDENVCDLTNMATLIYRDHDKSVFEPMLYATRITTDHWIDFPWE